MLIYNSIILFLIYAVKMAEQVLFVCYFDGTIEIDNETRVPKYAGGYCKPLVVHPAITYRELMDKIYELSNLSRRHDELRVLCKWWFDNGECVPINVTNDQETAAVIAYARKHSSTQLYVRDLPIISAHEALQRRLT